MENVLVLTPVKNARAHLATYFDALARLQHPATHLSLGLLESDSADGTYEALAERVPALAARYRRVGLWKRDFGFRIPAGMPRWADPIQLARRSILAKSRNQLLSRALDDEDWVLWLDVDVVEYPPDVIARMCSTGKRIVEPHCVREYGGRTFDLNAWRDRGRLHLEDLRGGDDLERLDAVGGTMLLVHADVHRDGLVFPTFLYGAANPRVRPGRAGEIETEGLGLLAHDMGVQPWGMPKLEILHARD